MSMAIEKYLDRIMVYANRNQSEAPYIRAELQDHLLKKVSDLEETGMAREDAIFQAIEDHGDARKIGYSLRRKFPLIDVRYSGTARGFIAVGPKAIGIIAFGRVACGIVSLGIISIGIISFGAISLALLMSLGFIAVGALTGAGIGAGLLATGDVVYGLWTYASHNAHSLYAFDTAPAFIRTIVFPVFKMFEREAVGSIILFAIISVLLLGYLERKRIKKSGVMLAQ